jgi:hypothetical protein
MMMMIMFLIPLAALVFDSNMVGVTYPDFFAHITLLWIILLTMTLWWKKQQWLRPTDVKMPNWEGMLFLYARWPWSLIGTIAAVRDWIRGSALDFRVTPKGRIAAEPLPFRVLAPYAFLSLVSGLPILLLSNVKVAVGFYFFASENSALYAFLLLVIIVMHRRENPSVIPALELSAPVEP